MTKINTEVYSTKDYVLIKVPRKSSEEKIKTKGISSLRGGLKSSFKNTGSVELQHKIAALIAK